MPEARANFQQVAEVGVAGELPRALGAGEERKFRGAADEAAQLGGRVADAAGGGEVDAERLFGEQIFAGAEHVEVERFVEVMRDGDIDHVDRRVAQHLVVVARQQAHGGYLAEPFPHRGLHVADGDELDADGEIEQRAPAADGAGDFATHEAAADDAEAEGAHFAAMKWAASAAVAPSWTMARSARVMPAGSACWMIFRP